MALDRTGVGRTRCDRAISTRAARILRPSVSYCSNVARVQRSKRPEVEIDSHAHAQLLHKDQIVTMQWCVLLCSRSQPKSLHVTLWQRRTMRQTLRSIQADVHQLYYSAHTPWRWDFDCQIVLCCSKAVLSVLKARLRHRRYWLGFRRTEPPMAMCKAGCGCSPKHRDAMSLSIHRAASSSADQLHASQRMAGHAAQYSWDMVCVD